MTIKFDNMILISDKLDCNGVKKEMRKEDSGNMHSFMSLVFQGTREMGRWLEGNSGMRKKLFKMGDTNGMCMKMRIIR